MALPDFLKSAFAIPNPQSQMLEILAFSEKIQSITDLRTLKNLFDQKGNPNHPQLCYDFGVAFLMKGERAYAKTALITGALHGKSYPAAHYNTPFVNAIGQCFMLLVTQFPVNYSDKAVSATSLAYIYLSRCIELSGREAQDSYRSRALLFIDHEDSVIPQKIVLNNLGVGVLTEPLLISDFYFAARATGSPYQDLLVKAKKMHLALEDIGIGGKDADEYSLAEMAELGEKRNYTLFKNLETKYKQGEFNLTLEEIVGIFK